MACPSCGAENPEHARFCLSCGRPLAAGEPTESRRPVSILFVDLAGSTDLSHRLDAETLHHVMSDYYGAARAAVGRHGGHIEKFIGDAVMAVFGFPKAHEDDALRAVQAAWDLGEALAEINERLDERWGVRLVTRSGIATGTVVASDRSTGEPFVVGTTVNLAARLEQTAGPGEIRIDGTTKRIVRDDVVTQAISIEGVRGFDGTVPAHRVLGVAAAGDGLRRPEPPFVNREAELRLLGETLDRHLASARCRSVTLIGSAGLGKSRLLREFLDISPAAGAVLASRCPAYGEGSALQPLLDVVSQAAGASTSDPPETVVDRIREQLADHRDGSLATQGIGRALGLVPGPTTQEETAWSIRLYFETVAARTPLVLVFDDVQWAAPALLDVLEHLAEWTRDAPILLVCLARPELLNTRPTWGRTPGSVTMQLEPLAKAPSRQLARHLLVTATGPGVEDRITAAADGNPFFLEEIVRMLQEEGAISPVGDEPDPDYLSIPPTISALLAARIDRLETTSREVLERAAVLGLAFQREPVEALLPEGSTIDVSATLDDLTGRDFVVADPETPHGFRFRHALTREAAYDAIPKSSRVRLHSIAAERLAEEPAGEMRDERVGYHLEQAHRAATDLGSASEARDLGERAGAHLTAAGRSAAGRGDVRAAADLFERAAAILPRGHVDRPDVLIDLHDALFYSGEIERSEGPVAEVLAGLEPDDRSVLAERARLRQTMLRFLLDLGSMPVEAQRADVERAVRRFEEAGDRSNLAEALAHLATVLWAEGNAAEMLDAAERALHHARACGSRRAVAEAAPLIAFALHRGRIPLDDALERLRNLRADLAGNRLAEARILVDEAMMLVRVGAAEDARTAAERARETFEDLGQRRWLEGSKEMRAEIARNEGRPADAEGLLRSALRFFRDQGDTNNALQIAGTLADLLCDLGRLEEAESLAGEIARDGSPDDLEIQVAWRSIRARTRARSGDLDAALPLAEEAAAIADSTDFLLLQADAHRRLGGILTDAGRSADAIRALDAAVQRYEAKRAAVPAAETRDRLAELRP